MLNRNILTFLLLCLILPATGKDCDIPLTPIVKTSASVSYYPDVDSYITNRLRNIISDSGNNSGLDFSQFALVFDYNILDKQIVDGMPTKVLYEISANYHIIDLKNNNTFLSQSQTLKGIGNNDQKSLLNAFQKISSSNSILQDFIDKGKNKIVDYYDKNYKNIIKEALALAATRNYDQAIYNLMMIPKCCNGYTESLNVMTEVFQQFVNQHCNENLAQARAAWNSSPNQDGAISASIFLSEIYPDAACYGEAMALAEEIKSKLGDQMKFQMKQWNDNVALEQQRIDAMREIGLAYALSQNNSKTNQNENK